MSQNWSIPMPSSEILGTSRTNINDALQSLQSSFSGASAPSSPVAGQWFLDTSTTPDSLRLYDGTAWRTILPDITSDGGGLVYADGTVPFSGSVDLGNNKLTNVASGTAAGDGINKSQADSRNKVAVVRLGDIAGAGGTVKFPLFASATAATVVATGLVVSNNPSSGSGTNKWVVTVANETDALTLTTYDSDTDGDPTAYARKSMGAVSNPSLDAGDTLSIQFAAMGTPPDFDDVTVLLEFQQNTP